MPCSRIRSQHSVAGRVGRAAARRTCGRLTRSARGNDGQPEPRARRPCGASSALVALEDVAPLAPGSTSRCSSCAVQVCRQHVGQAERRADVLPGVLVDLAEEERPAVGALVVEHPGPVDVAASLSSKRPTLAADDVLGVVEALGGEPAEAAQRLARASDRKVRARCPRSPRRQAGRRAPCGCPSMSQATPA